MSATEAAAAGAVQKRPADAPAAWFNHRPGEFVSRFNVLPFPVSHNLTGHPLFELPRLVELAKMLWCKAEGRVIFHDGDVPVDLRWDEIAKRASSLTEGLSRIQDSGSWVSLKRINQDAEYKVLVDECAEELATLAGIDLARVTSLLGSFFISSPHSVTPYHIDHEGNFLLQLHGERNVYVCDPNDRAVLTEQEIESFYAGNMSAARYNEDNERMAHVFHLTPGKGVHIPSRGPHWVRNGNEYSVALSVNFCLSDMDRGARVYQVNHYLRRLRMKPAPPGQSALKDWLKIMVMSDLRRPRQFANNYEMVTRNVKRLDRSLHAAERVLRRPRSHQ